MNPGTTATTAATTAAAAASAQRLQAIKASGVLVRLAPEAFSALLTRQEAPLVVHARTGLVFKDHIYLVSHRGLAFHTESHEPLSLPAAAEVVEAESVSIPA